MNTTDEKKRRQFLDLVRALANLRDVQYGDNQSESLVERALLIPTVNLPSNLLRAAAIFVDFRFGFRPKEDSFGPPAWVTSLKQLPENERGSLGCSNFREIEAAEEGDSVILLHDHPASGLMAGAAGVIRQVDQSEISGADD